ncbi:hypothetical protein PUN28_019410 [Cardiocondyla obscurior]|uniref:Uncharacterized protein n=1 Tax=Cardiocondyla obscurior TaxID=286306 RepID=A0AAW2EBC9_9HYME
MVKNNVRLFISNFYYLSVVFRSNTLFSEYYFEYYCEYCKIKFNFFLYLNKSQFY